jgi:integral membrane sensor domain MASE1
MKLMMAAVKIAKAIGFAIVVLSIVILLTGHSQTYWFIPVNVRNGVLTAVLLLVPAAIIVISHWLQPKQRFHSLLSMRPNQRGQLGVVYCVVRSSLCYRPPHYRERYVQ